MVPIDRPAFYTFRTACEQVASEPVLLCREAGVDQAVGPRNNQYPRMGRSMRIPVLVFLLASAVVIGAQPPLDLKLQTQLKQLFPYATAFSPKEGFPPHFKAYVDDPDSGQPTLAGYAFWTTELEPLERGYDGPIQVLVGVDLNGILTGIIVVSHNEPYGYFSIDMLEFVEQFTRKNIRDRFRVGTDVDGVSSATLTVTSTTRAVRNGARRIARQFLVPDASR